MTLIFSSEFLFLYIIFLGDVSEKLTDINFQSDLSARSFNNIPKLGGI